MAGFMDRIRASINVLAGKQDPLLLDPSEKYITSSPSSIGRSARYDSTQAVLAPIITRISMDVAAIPMYHVIVDEFRRFQSIRQSELNDRLRIRANLDQSGAAFIQDAARKMLEYGACALVPIEISSYPNEGGFDILSIRAGTITQWYNRSVQVAVYNELNGEIQEIMVPKGYAAIAYNPLYHVMNEPNSTLKRLIDRLSLLDVADGNLFSPKLDLIVQLPYVVRNSRMEAEAQRRLEMIDTQLGDKKYGIAYIDGTESITQLNRPVTNGLVETVDKLQTTLYAQLGLTQAVFAGDAEDKEIINYNNRTIFPIVTALSEAMATSFFTRTAIRQGHSVMGLPNIFKMAPIGELSDAADKLTRNEIVSSNEIRMAIGLNPSKDPEANELRNKNLNKPTDQESTKPPVEAPKDDPEAADDDKE